MDYTREYIRFIDASGRIKFKVSPLTLKVESIRKFLSHCNTGGTYVLNIGEGISLVTSEQKMKLHAQNISKSIEGEYRSSLCKWLESIITDIQAREIGYMSLLPKEMLRELLLYRTYEELLQLCSDFEAISWIWEDSQFWVRKAAQLGVNEKHFGFSKLTPDERYLELLSQWSKDICRGMERHLDSDARIRRAFKVKRRDLVDYFLQLGEYSFDLVARCAAKGADTQLFDSMLKEAKEKNSGHVSALDGLGFARCGGTRLLDWLITNGVIVSVVFAEAYRYGPKEYLTYLYGKGFKNEDAIPRLGTHMGARGDLQYLREFVASPEKKQELVEGAVEGAAKYGHLEMIRYLMGPGVGGRESMGECFEIALEQGHTHILDYLRSLGMNVRKSHIITVVTCRQIKSLKWLISKGYFDIDRALYFSARHGVVPMVEYCIANGATQIEQALLAYQKGIRDEYISPNEDLRKFLESRLGVVDKK